MVNRLRQRVADRTDADPNGLQCRDWSEWAGRSWVCGFSIALSIASLGIAASLYPDQIKASWWNLCFACTDFSGPATMFWTGVYAAAGLFMWRNWAENQYLVRDSEARKALIAEQKEASESLRREVRSLPPESFLTTYVDAIPNVEEQASQVRSVIEDESSSYCLKREFIIKGIQAGLAAMIELTRSFDQPSEDRYAANVMLYIPTSLLPSKREKIKKRLLAVEDEVSVGSLLGILDFREDLTLVSSQDDADLGKDTNHPPVAFAIPERYQADNHPDEDGNPKWRIAPGAPKALLKESAELFGDTQEIREWLEKRSTLGSEIRDQIMEYVESNREPQIGSFFTTPLLGLQSDDEGDEAPRLLNHNLPYGILNIHRSGPGILKGRNRSQAYFETMVLPIKIRIASLIRNLAIIEYDRFDTWGHLSTPSAISND
mgnify:CR=1 FL=1